MDLTSTLSCYAPVGSTMTFNDDGSINVVPPSGWQYIGYDSGGVYAELDPGAGVCVTCTCTSGGSCSGVIVGNQVGCSMGVDCTICLISVSSIIGSTHFSSGGFINTLATAEIINLTDTVAADFDAMGENTLVQSTLTSYINSVYGGGTPPDVPIIDGVATAPDGYILALVNIMGRAIPIPVPVDEFDGGTDAGGTTASCGCNNSGACVLSSGHGITSCSSSGCTGSCTLCTQVSGSQTYASNWYQF